MSLSPFDLRRPVPPGWKFFASADTGTYMSCTFTLFPPDESIAFVTEEFPNYRYVGGEIELLGLSVPEWARRVMQSFRLYSPSTTRLKGYVDENSQFKEELKHYGLHFRGNKRKLELRVEIAREYFQNRRVYLAPWLTILPWELEHAVWPDDTNSAGRFERLKEHDHTLDTLEHTLSRRPRGRHLTDKPTQGFVAREIAQYRVWRQMNYSGIDPQLGLL